MNPLPEDYFKRDLSLEEEEQLAQWLDSSPEGTQRMIDLMEWHYRRLAIPEPDWSEGPLPDFFPKPRKPMLPFFLLVFLALPLSWVGYSAIQWFAELSPVSSQVNPHESRIISPTPSTMNTKRKTVPARTIAKPLGKAYEELSVVVVNQRPGLVTVRVLDIQSAEILLLYAGILPQGQRTFTWNGKASDGKRAPPGKYYLEVTSGEKVMRQELNIR